MVDLAPDDIRSVLMPPEQQPGGVARDLSAAAQRAWAVLQQAEEQLGTGGLQSCAPLLDAVGELRERCGAAQAALGAARVGCSEQAAAGARLGVEGLEQRLAAAAADIAELEARLG